MLGEQRAPALSKNVPYEPASHVPCIVRGSGFPKKSVDAPVHMFVDVTATCVDLAGVRGDHTLDGVSLRDIVADPGHYADRALLYDRDDRDDEQARRHRRPPACSRRPTS